jgi:hypothetical protein
MFSKDGSTISETHVMLFTGGPASTFVVIATPVETMDTVWVLKAV